MAVNTEISFTIAPEDLDVMSTVPPTATSHALARVLGAKFALYVAATERSMFEAACEVDRSAGALVTPYGEEAQTHIKPANDLRHLGAGFEQGTVPYETRLEFAQAAKSVASYMLHRSRLEDSIGAENLGAIDAAVNLGGYES